MSMSKAQDLKKNRKLESNILSATQLQVVPEADSLEEYYSEILSVTEDDNVVDQYKDDIENVTQEFLVKTRIQKADWGFLFFATMLQCVRIFVLNKMIDKATELERANVKGGREDKLHEFQDKVLSRFSKGKTAYGTDMYASLEAIITMRGVPYDATSPLNEEIKKLKLFKGANHRFSTLGHDPILGLIFGTANILTNTITTNKKILIITNSVVYDDELRNPRIGGMVSTIEMLKSAAKRFEDDKASVAAAIIKQLIHIGTDLYTPCGIQLPFESLFLSNTTVEKLTKYISTGDVIKVGASAEMSMMINSIIAGIHGCSLLFDDKKENCEEELLEARTRKIIMYSNLLASSSNLISAALSNDIKKVDWGGIMVTIYRLFSDANFIVNLEREYLDNRLNELYEEKYKEIEQYYN